MHFLANQFMLKASFSLHLSAPFIDIFFICIKLNVRKVIYFGTGNF